MYHMKLVIARYDEDVTWTNGLKDVIIYNKSSSLPNSKHPFKQLTNVGREGHTYLHHIIQNYDQLDEYTCFMQGNPFNHSHDIEIRLQLFEKNPIPFYFLSHLIYNYNLSYDTTPTPRIENVLQRTYRAIFGKDKINHHYQFGPGAQFIVSRDLIRSRSKEFYENILHILERHMNPIEGHALERFWHMIFTHSE